MPVKKNLRIPQETLEEIEKVAHQSSSDFSSIAKDFLTEAIKMRRCPGIVFADGVSGRKARIAGIGLEVWDQSMPPPRARESCLDIRNFIVSLLCLVFFVIHYLCF